MLRTALIVVAGFDLMLCLVREDLLQLGLLAAIVAVLAVIAAWRQRIPLANAAATVSYATQLAIVLVAVDGFIDNWTAAVALAVVGACSIGFACLYVGLPPVRAALVPAGVAVVLAELTVLTVSPDIGTGGAGDHRGTAGCLRQPRSACLAGATSPAGSSSDRDCSWASYHQHSSPTATTGPCGWRWWLRQRWPSLCQASVSHSRRHSSSAWPYLPRSESCSSFRWHR